MTGKQAAGEEGGEQQGLREQEERQGKRRG